MIEITQVMLDIVSPANPGHYEHKEELQMYLRKQNPELSPAEVNEVYMEALAMLFNQPKEV